jgi:hypothetical protein
MDVAGQKKAASKGAAHNRDNKIAIGASIHVKIAPMIARKSGSRQRHRRLLVRQRR